MAATSGGEGPGGEGKVCLGAITGAHGVRGEVRIRPFTETPEAVAAYGPVTLEDGRMFAIRVTKRLKEGVAARLDGVSDRDAAEALKGESLYVDRERLGEPQADEDGEEAFFHADLIGLAVEDEDGTEIGRVIAIHDFGAGDLLEVRLTGTRKTAMLPFTRACCPVVDVAAGRITAHPPAGLLDAGADGERDEGEKDEGEARDG